MANNLVTLALTLAMLVVNGLGSAGKLGVSMADLNSIFPFHFMPPAVMFMASWALIFLLQLVYVVMLFVKKETVSQKEFWLNFALLVANISWMAATTQTYYMLSVGIIVAMYVLLVLLTKEFQKQKNTQKSIIFGIYLGWITAATFAVAFGQVAYTLAPEFALSDMGAYSALGLGILANLATFAYVKNPYALVWAFIALAAAALKYFGIFF